jgi:hypothetical protein
VVSVCDAPAPRTVDKDGACCEPTAPATVPGVATAPAGPRGAVPADAALRGEPADPVPLEPAGPPAPPTGTVAEVPPAEAVASPVGELDCTAPVEPDAVFPPPTCAAPVEPFAEFPPPEPPADAPTLADLPAERAATEGSAWLPLTCAVPVEPGEVLPPPTCTAPVELDAVLSPPLPTVTGAVEEADVPSLDAPHDGLALTAPTWTAPVELVAVLPARAGAAVASMAAHTPAARLRALRFMVSSLSRRYEVAAGRSRRIRHGYGRLVGPFEVECEDDRPRPTRPPGEAAGKQRARNRD